MKVCGYDEEAQAVFRRMYAEGARLRDIAAALGGKYSSPDSERSVMSYMALRLGLRRERKSMAVVRHRPRYDIDRRVTLAPEAVNGPTAPVAHPFWTPSRDAMILRTEGRYADLSAVAEALGRPMATVLQRWHQVRAA